MKAKGRHQGNIGRWCLANGLVLAGLAFHVVLQAVSSTELVRLRNAAVLNPAPADAMDWKPAAMPAGFRRETLPPDPRYLAVVQAIGADRGADYGRMLAIAAHLVEGPRQEEALATDSWRAYLGIRAGGGYCADFTQVFLVLAHAAGLTAREWGFSFDGFGGWGHAVVEVFDRQRDRWVFLDVFNNFHAVNAADGEPLDVGGWRRAVARGGEGVRVVLNGPGRFGWKDGPAGMWEYYQRGLDGWYLWQGNAILSYERQPLVSLAGRFSRSLEQLAAIVTGVHPRIQVLLTDGNRADFERMRRLRQTLLVELPLLAMASLSLAAFLAAWLWSWLRPLKGEGGGSAGAGSGPPRVLLVGPLPPPSGGMAVQCRQLEELLKGEGVEVGLVQTNAPYRPAWAGRLRGLRAVFRLLPYVWRLWAALPRHDVVHVFANSGWAWYLLAAPAILLASLRRVPVIVNYHGGEADRFFAAAPAWTRRTLALADVLVVPSGFLEQVFRRLGFNPLVVPNVVDLARFRSLQRVRSARAPHLIVVRNLEPVYDIATAIRAFALVAGRLPEARLTVAGTGPELPALEGLAAELGLAGKVSFPGRIDNGDIHALYAGADLALNPSRADNLPISILEAFASGVPVVSTDVGGVPYLVRNGENGLLVPAQDHLAMADAALAILDDPQFASFLATNGLRTAEAFGWPRVRRLWLETYGRLTLGRRLACHA